MYSLLIEKTMKKIKALIVSIIVVLVSLQGSAQVNIEVPVDNKIIQWQEFYRSDSFLLSYKYADCSDDFNGIYHDYILIKAENLTDKQLLVDWNYLLYYDNECVSCNLEDDEYMFRIIFEPFQAFEPDCFSSELPEQNRLRIFRSFINDPGKDMLTKLVLGNLTVMDLN